MALLNFFLLASLFVAGVNSLATKVKPPSIGNLPRKLKRALKTADAAKFQTLLTPEYDTFLKGSTGALYNNLMDKISKTAIKLKVSVTPGFGVKPVQVLPNLVDTAIAAGSFQV